MIAFSIKFNIHNYKPASANILLLIEMNKTAYPLLNESTKTDYFIHLNMIIVFFSIGGTRMEFSCFWRRRIPLCSNH